MTTLLKYFAKVEAKGFEESNPRQLAPAFNKQHVENFTINRIDKFDAEVLDPSEQQVITIDNNTYIDDIKSGTHQPFRLNKKSRGPLRAKLLQFYEDVRPPYWGTWQRKSTIVKGRRPFGKDDNIFDYEVDSEAEWDIGGPGESLKGDDSEDEEEPDDYEIDMQTFVPHGYVSDDEVEVNSDQEQDQTVIQSSNNVKPIVLGIYYEKEPLLISETKVSFLKAFQGVSCATQI